MTRLIIITLSGMLLLGVGARAEEIYLNCKFIRGEYQLLTPFIRNEPVKNNDRNATDVFLNLDTTKRKILNFSDNKELGSFDKKINVFNWSNDNIEFLYFQSENWKIRYFLNRFSGNLKKVISFQGDANQSGSVETFFECKKQTKKF
jgi:hypothetical protein